MDLGQGVGRNDTLEQARQNSVRGVRVSLRIWSLRTMVSGGIFAEKKSRLHTG